MLANPLHCLRRIILMRLWVAEIHDHAVAQIFGDVAVEAGDHLGAARSQNITVSCRLSA